MTSNDWRTWVCVTMVTARCDTCTGYYFSCVHLFVYLGNRLHKYWFRVTCAAEGQEEERDILTVERGKEWGGRREEVRGEEWGTQGGGEERGVGDTGRR